jgi:hypothetical protein
MHTLISFICPSFLLFLLPIQQTAASDRVDGRGQNAAAEEYVADFGPSNLPVDHILGLHDVTTFRYVVGSSLTQPSCISTSQNGELDQASPWIVERQADGSTAGSATPSKQETESATGTNTDSGQQTTTSTKTGTSVSGIASVTFHPASPATDQTTGTATADGTDGAETTSTTSNQPSGLPPTDTSLFTTTLGQQTTDTGNTDTTTSNGPSGLPITETSLFTTSLGQQTTVEGQTTDAGTTAADTAQTTVITTTFSGSEVIQTVSLAMLIETCWC